MMKRHTLLLFFLFFTCLLHGNPPTPSKICLNMIVKNETNVIRRCLESVKPLIDYWVIVDTGSTDGTQAMIKEFMKDIPGELHERPWVDFAHNRNEALDLAKGKSEYILFIDADDILKFSPHFIKPKLDKDFYHLKIEYSGTSYTRTQLIKSNLDWKWVGVLHEVVISPDARSMELLPDVTMVILGGGDRSRDPKKFQKDAALLEKALEKDPHNTRTVFYLAQSYRDGDMLEQALKTYEKRVAMGGWDQEVFWSLYQIGILEEAMNKSQEVIAKSYSKAFTFRPVRAEPLYRLSQYYRRQENYLLGYITARLGLTISEPSDTLFVESWIYDYGLLLEFSICAYWIGRFEESFKASQLLLRKKDLPQDIRDCVNKNLSFILEKLPKQDNPELLKAAS